MNDDSILRKTLMWTGALLGLSAIWITFLCLTSMLVFSRPSSTDAATDTSPGTPGAKPASSDAPSRTPPRDDAPQKRRNG